MGIHSRTQDRSDFLKHRTFFEISTRETSSNIKKSKIEAYLLTLIKSPASTLDSIDMGVFI
jgi:hypothetical protein